MHSFQAGSKINHQLQLNTIGKYNKGHWQCKRGFLDFKCIYSYAATVDNNGRSPYDVAFIEKVRMQLSAHYWTRVCSSLNTLCFRFWYLLCTEFIDTAQKSYSNALWICTVIESSSSNNNKFIFEVSEANRQAALLYTART